ncbi:MAG: hypothetical protein EHM59_09515 [Betaproteobacteria bacterium]|nr:MAG: hypothetical protein EHM59_09515 [Betaproteobacteria bacterium]
MTLRVLDPRQSAEGEPLRIAPALASLDGSVVGLLDNSKIGTARFYDHLADILRSEHGVREFIRRRKPDMTRPAAAGLIGELSAADAIVSGIGD